MRDRFPGFYRPTADEIATMWRESLFALDASVLLNLHRSPRGMADDILHALTQVSGRLWLPFQAALQYQRQRPAVMAAQRRQFQEMRDAVRGALLTLTDDMARLQRQQRHSPIDPTSYLASIGEATDQFLADLKTLEAAHGLTEGVDVLRHRIDALVQGRIGPPPEGQAEVDGIYAEGETRCHARIPPCHIGDDTADQGVPYAHGGITYRPQFDGLVFWKQLLRQASDLNTHYVILLTDDVEHDWWWSVDPLSRKRLEPRPELVDEIVRVARVRQFHMYGTEQFLELSRHYLQPGIASVKVQHLRDVAGGAD